MRLFTTKNNSSAPVEQISPWGNFPQGQLSQWLAAAAWLMLWQLCCSLVDLPLLLPSPGQTASRLVQLAVTADFWLTVGATFSRICSGFFLAAVVGSLLAVAAAASLWVKTFLYPLFAVLQATPVASFTILALVWIRSSNLSIFISFIMVLPMVYRSVLAGIKSADRQLLEMGRAFRFSWWKKVRFLYLPAVLPFFVSACTTGLGFAWKSGIAAEVLGLPARAVGSEIYQAKIYLETADLFAWTIVVIFISIVLERLFVWAMGRLKVCLLRYGGSKL